MSELGEDLPPVLAQIAEAVGEDAALLIARTHGGTRVTVPVTVGTNWLTALIGRDKARAVIDALGGARRLDVPLGPEGGYTGSRRAMNRRIAELQGQGMTNPQIARALGITDRGLRKRRSKQQRGDDRQSEMPV